MTRIIVERTFEAPLTKDALHAVETRMAPCLDLYGVRWIRSRLSSDRKRMICEYEAADRRWNQKPLAHLTRDRTSTWNANSPITSTIWRPSRRVA